MRSFGSCAPGGSLRRSPSYGDFARAALAHFKVPTAFHFVTELPENRDRKDPEIRIARQSLGHRAAVSGERARSARASVCSRLNGLEMAGTKLAAFHHHHS